MAHFEWKDQYSVGIPVIDEQHKKLVAMVNELYEAMSTGKGKDVLGKVLNDLIQYTKVHFQLEERLMQQHGYPEFAAHKAEHDTLTHQALDLSAKYVKGQAALTIQTGNFLRDWLAKHIQGTDKKYAPFLQAKGVH